MTDATVTARKLRTERAKRAKVTTLEDQLSQNLRKYQRTDGERFGISAGDLPEPKAESEAILESFGFVRESTSGILVWWSAPKKRDVTIDDKDCANCQANISGAEPRHQPCNCDTSRGAAKELSSSIDIQLIPKGDN